MSKLNLKSIKEKLLAERELLIDKLKGNDLSVDDSETPDPVDLAVRNYSKNVMLAVSENESRQLTLIDEALFASRTTNTARARTARIRSTRNVWQRSPGRDTVLTANSCSNRACWKKNSGLIEDH